MASIVRCLNIGLVLMFFAVFLQLLGYAVPSWMYLEIYSNYNSFHPITYEPSVASYSFALWYVTRCFDNSCGTMSYFQINSDIIEQSDLETDERDYAYLKGEFRFPFSRMVEFQFEATLALVFGYLAFHTSRKQKTKYIQYFKGKRQDKPSPRRHCLIFSLSLSSGILVLIPFTELANLNVRWYSAQSQDHKIIKIGERPYGLILSGVGGVLALLACVFMLFTLCCAPCSDSNAENNGMYAGEPENGDSVDDTSNNQVGIQLVPLAPSGFHGVQGYTDPAVPGYVPTWEHVHRNPTNHNLTISAHNFPHEPIPNEDTHDLPFRENRTGSFEEPPPSYDEVMRSGNYDPP